MSKFKRASKGKKGTISIVLLLLLGVSSYFKDDIQNKLYDIVYGDEVIVSYNIDEIPEYTGQSYVVINNNQPNFDAEDYKSEIFEKYSRQDSLGRSRTAFASIGKESMPKEERGSIGQIKPTGWHTVKYDIVDGKYLYNRCHLIGYQLTGQNANERNLITCTRHMNTVGMLKFENKVAEYIKETGNHVLYRVTPMYEENNLLASGVQIEASSIEDKGASLSINVFVYNVQDGIVIDYTTGNSKLAE